MENTELGVKSHFFGIVMFIYTHILYIIAHDIIGRDQMVTMTLAVPKELKSEMETFKEINWSEVARQAFKQKIRDLKILQKFKSDSELTEEDAIKLGREVNKKLAKRYA